MHHVVLALRSHIDLAKLDFEDGLLRQMAAGQLARRSSISRIVVDLRAEDQGPGANRADFHGLLWMSAEDQLDLDPDSISAQLTDVAAEVSGWRIESTEVSELDRSWVGSATPGIKLAFLLRRSSGIDDDEFAAAIRGAAEKAVELSPTTAVSSHRVIDDFFASPGLDGIVTFGFPSNESMADAAGQGLFAPLAESDAIDPATAQRLAVFEHRLLPNPNIWEDAGQTDSAAEG